MARLEPLPIPMATCGRLRTTLDGPPTRTVPSPSDPATGRASFRHELMEPGLRHIPKRPPPGGWGQVLTRGGRVVRGYLDCTRTASGRMARQLVPVAGEELEGSIRRVWQELFRQVPFEGGNVVTEDHSVEARGREDEPRQGFGCPCLAY